MLLINIETTRRLTSFFVQLRVLFFIIIQKFIILLLVKNIYNYRLCVYNLNISTFQTKKRRKSNMDRMRWHYCF